MAMPIIMISTGSEMQQVVDNNQGTSSGSRFLSNQEVRECIRSTSPVLHTPVSPTGRVDPEILSQYDKDVDDAVLDGFSLRPNTIGDMECRIAFSTRVHQEWIRHSALAYNGTALPGISYAEATGHFQLEAPGPGPLPGDFFIDKAGLQRTLASLVRVALNEGVKQHLTEGGDERLHLSLATGKKRGHQGVNKYHCPPHPVPSSTVVRGSCTCSPPSPRGFQAAQNLLYALWNGTASAEDAFCDVRRRISTALRIRTAHHVILHPSGTDAEFTALLVGLNQARRIGCSGVVNVVVGAKEVGSNTATAAGGHHFANYFPVDGTTSTEIAKEPGIAFQSVAVGGGDLRDGIKVVELAVRSDDGSTRSDFDAIVLQTLEAASKDCISDGGPQPFFVVHAVDGSKLGSHITSRALVEQIHSLYGRHVLFVLDACQARTDAEELDWYLSHNAVVLVTASKFFGAPGFCAAVLVPHAAAEAGHLTMSGTAAMREWPSKSEYNLGKYITRLEVPPELAALRESLPPGPTNVGLLLRWSCGVAEMERFAQAGQAGRQAIGQWVDGVRDVIRHRRPHLQLLRDSGCNDDDEVPFPAAPTFVGGVNSIVSFCIARGERTVDDSDRVMAGASLFNAVDLKRFHKWLTEDISGSLPAVATDAERQVARLTSFIGQPVDLGNCAVLRLAIGASLASDLADGSRYLGDVLADDGKVLDKILLAKRYWNTLCSRHET
ncbi:hypothetical protein SEUCBS139899_009756 [Sporothrix eucalyptigena]|uniref:Uncharacterized protein n=1 Tax=Sporothrix eucalyptigena TaxID=1812306 RepID=A0ABP0CXZ3_9PEZI